MTTQEQSRIRVLHFIDLPGPVPFLNGIAAHYDRSRFEHVVATLGPRNELHRELERRGVSSFAMAATSRTQFPLAVGRLARLLRSEQIDILQTHLFWPSLLGLCAGSLARTPVKLVTRHHSDFTTTFNHPIHRRLDQLQAHWADHVLAASEAVKRDMMRFESVPDNRITVARYGYDFEDLRPELSPDDRVRLRRELGAEGRTLIVTTARLSPEKGHRFLFDALSALIGPHPDLLLVLVGIGPLDGELRALASTLGISEHVRFLGWRNDAHRIIEAADLVVHPSFHEAFCSVIIESMAMERPLVAANVAAAPEQIDNTGTGLLVPPRDSEALRVGIEWVLQNREASAAMGRLARERVVERFSFPRMMALYEAVYEQFATSAKA
ncbi:MAG: glycosyltransferase [Acidimicrobiales bacterium]